MGIVAWREPKVQDGHLSQGHEDGTVLHSGKVTCLAATDEMLYSVDDAGFLLVRSSREKVELKFIDAEGVQADCLSRANASEYLLSSVASELERAVQWRERTGQTIAIYTSFKETGFEDLLVPNVLLTTEQPEACYAPPESLFSVLHDPLQTTFDFLGLLICHYFPSRTIEKETPAQTNRWTAERMARHFKAEEAKATVADIVRQTPRAANNARHDFDDGEGAYNEASSSLRDEGDDGEDGDDDGMNPLGKVAKGREKADDEVYFSDERLANLSLWAHAKLKEQRVQEDAKEATSSSSTAIFKPSPPHPAQAIQPSREHLKKWVAAKLQAPRHEEAPP